MILSRSAILSLMILSIGCSSASLDRVPEIEPGNLPPLKLEMITAKSIQLTVRNRREINKKAGNSIAVEKAVYDALSDSIQRGGRTVGKSRWHLDLELKDCPSSQEGVACVVLGGKFQMPGRNIGLNFRSSHSYKRQNRSSHADAFGDVAVAYRTVLELLITDLEEDFSRAHASRRGDGKALARR